jgi:8-oxo-dGTP pyrophosphatase MutT (NUDIX family)
MKRNYQHPIQQSILEDLRVSSIGLRYTDMKPDGVENDLYNYHLQYLVKHELVTKNDDRYRLSLDGKRHLIELNPLDDSGQSSRFKLASLCLLTRGTGDKMEVLYQERLRQPFYGHWGLIGGGIKRGEPALETAARRLREEAGLVAKFTLFGMIRKIHFERSGQLGSDILFHICLSDIYNGNLERHNNFGNQSWVSLAQAVEFESSGAMGSNQIAIKLQQLGTSGASSMPFFYIEQAYHQDIV